MVQIEELRTHLKELRPHPGKLKAPRKDAWGYKHQAHRPQLPLLFSLNIISTLGLTSVSPALISLRSLCYKVGASFSVESDRLQTKDIVDWRALKQVETTTGAKTRDVYNKLKIMLRSKRSDELGDVMNYLERRFELLQAACAYTASKLTSLDNNNKTLIEDLSPGELESLRDASQLWVLLSFLQARLSQFPQIQSLGLTPVQSTVVCMNSLALLGKAGALEPELISMSAHILSTITTVLENNVQKIKFELGDADLVEMCFVQFWAVVPECKMQLQEHLRVNLYKLFCLFFKPPLGLNNMRFCRRLTSKLVDENQDIFKVKKTPFSEDYSLFPVYAEITDGPEASGKEEMKAKQSQLIESKRQIKTELVEFVIHRIMNKDFKSLQEIYECLQILSRVKIDSDEFMKIKDTLMSVASKDNSANEDKSTLNKSRTNIQHIKDHLTKKSKIESDNGTPTDKVEPEVTKEENTTNAAAIKDATKANLKNKNKDNTAVKSAEDLTKKPINSNSTTTTTKGTALTSGPISFSNFLLSHLQENLLSLLRSSPPSNTATSSFSLDLYLSMLMALSLLKPIYDPRFYVSLRPSIEILYCQIKFLFHQSTNIDPDGIYFLYLFFYNSQIIDLDLLKLMESHLPKTLTKLSKSFFLALIHFYSQAPISISNPFPERDLIQYIKLHFSDFQIGQLMDLILCAIKSCQGKILTVWGSIAFLDSDLLSQIVQIIMGLNVMHMDNLEKLKLYRILKILSILWADLMNKEVIESRLSNLFNNLSNLNQYFESNFQKEVEKYLKQLPKKVEKEVLLEKVLMVDFLVDGKIVLEVNGPSHYFIVLPAREEEGILKNRSTLTKQTLIEQLGYAYREIEYFKWTGLTSKFQKRELIMNSLRRASPT